MNEQAIQDMFSLAQANGYNKGIEDFKSLMSSNESALNDMHVIAKDNGYERGIEDFSVLMGVKKKDQSMELASSGEEKLAGLGGEVDLHNIALDFNKKFQEYSAHIRDPKYVDADLVGSIEEYKASHPIVVPRTIYVPRMAGEAAISAQQHTIEFTIKEQNKGVEETKKDWILSKEREALDEMKGQLLSGLSDEQKNDKDLLKSMSDKLFFDYGLDLDLDGDGQYNEQWLLEDMTRAVGAGAVDLGASVLSFITAAMDPRVAYQSYGDVRRSHYEDMYGVGEDIREGQTQYSATSQGIANSFENGNVWNGARQLSTGLAETAPQIVGTVALGAATGGAAIPAIAFGTIGAAGYYQQTELADLRAVDAGEIPLYDNNWQRLGGSAVAGIGEAAFTYVGLKAGTIADKIIPEQFLQGWFKKIGVEPTLEAMEEAGTELASIMYEGSVGNATLSNDEIFHRLTDAALLGYAAGGTFSALLGNKNKDHARRAITASNSRSEAANQNPDLLEMQDALSRQEDSGYLGSFVEKELEAAVQDKKDRIAFFEMLSIRHPESMDNVQMLDGQIEHTAHVLKQYDKDGKATTPAAVASKGAAVKVLKAKLEGLIKERQDILSKHSSESLELSASEQIALDNSKIKSKINALETNLQLAVDEVTMLESQGASETDIAQAKARMKALRGHLETVQELASRVDLDTEAGADVQTPATAEVVEAYTKELNETIDSDPETYWSVSRIEAVDAKDNVVIHTADGGASVKPDGDIVGVYKNPKSKKRGVGQKLLESAIAAGGTKLDNFDNYLTKVYENAGFRVVSRTPFNEQYAPEGWNKDKHGTPDVVAMVYDPNGSLDFDEKSFEGYDDAIAYRDEVLAQKPSDTNNAKEQLREKLDEGPAAQEGDVPSTDGDGGLPSESDPGVDEGIFVKYEGKNPWKKFTNKLEFLRRKWLSARRFSTISGKAIMESMAGKIGVAMHNVEADIRVFNKIYNAFKGDKSVLLNDYDAAIRGDKDALSRLPEDFAVHAKTVRNRVDELSQALIDSGYYDLNSEADRKRMATVQKNIGSYLTRSYEAYDSKNWKDIVSERVINDAKNYIRKEISKSVRLEYDNGIEGTKGLTFEEYLAKRVEGEINAYLNKPDVEEALLQQSKPKSLKDLRKHRQDVAPEILALLGEHKSPMRNYAESVAKLVQAVEKTKALNKLREKGMGSFFFQTRQGRYSELIASPDSKSPLNGLYTTPEMAAELNRIDKSHGKALQLYMKFLSSIKWAKTIGSVATHAKNVVGNLGFMWANGHTDITKFATAYETLRNRFSSDEELRKAYLYYMELGLVNQSAGLGEIKRMFKEANLDEAMGERSSARENISVLGKANVARKKAGKWAENVYQAEDDFFKIVAFENELARYSDAYYGKPFNELTDSQKQNLESEIAEKIKNTYPTYDRVPEAINLLKRSPLLGNFISFTAESYRVAFNSAAIAVEEMKSDNPKIRKIGAKRAIGLASYNTLKTTVLSTLGVKAGAGMVGLIGMAFNDDEEDEKMQAIRSVVPHWSTNSDLIIISASNGKVTYIDASASDPYGEVFKNFNVILNEGVNPRGLAKATMSALEPFIGLEMGTALVEQVHMNQDAYGRPIYNEEDDWGKQSRDITAHIYKSMEPGTITSARKVMEAENTDLEVFGQLTGFKPHTVDVEEWFGYKASAYHKRIEKINKIKYTDYDSANEKMEALYEEYRQDIKNAELLGIGTLEIRNQMMKWDKWMSKKKANAIILGKPIPLKRP